MFKYTTIIYSALVLMACKTKNPISENNLQENPIEIQENIKEIVEVPAQKPIRVGAAQSEKYLPILEGKRIGIVTNQTGIIQVSDTKGMMDTLDYQIHLVDFLLSKNIQVKKIFAPEHGFRGKADAGETVKDGKDTKTGLPIISLYGDNKKPYKSQIEDLDIIIYDIQDVGARFYTYISTLHYVMEAAAENNKKVIVFDRPNPNCTMIDGPILEPEYKSFVGMHPVPIVYGMTVAEYAMMINGEHWLKNKVVCDLTIIPLENYTRDMPYELPIKPSPNLPNALSINLYASTCFFEGTNVSEGRGTEKQFQVYGSPYLKNMNYSFTPKPNEGSKSPRYNGELCYGEDLTQEEFLDGISLKWLIKAHQNNTKQPFWIKNSGELWIDKLAGTDQLRKQIDAGKTETEIKATWQEGLNAFKEMREKYLIYE